MKIIALVLASLAMLSSCNEEDCATSDHGSTPPPPPEVITDIPTLTASVDGKPFNGLIETYPCKSGGFVYFGNYRDNTIVVFPPTYLIKNGDVEQYTTQIRLPKDNYNLVFWGIGDHSQYTTPQVHYFQVRLGADLSDSVMALRRIFGDTTYSPVFDYCFAQQSVNVGSQNITLNMQRAVAGLELTVRNGNGLPFNASIVGFEILVSGIAEYMYFATGQPTYFTRTIKFPLKMAADRLSASNQMVMMFPSEVPPPIRVVTNTFSGKSSYLTTLPITLTAGTILTHTIDLPTEI